MNFSNCTYQSVVGPLNSGLLVGIGVLVTLDGTGLTAEETVQVGADLVGTAVLGGVALSATGLERRFVSFGFMFTRGRINSPGRAWHP
jgi:hypothetical protein